MRLVNRSTHRNGGEVAAGRGRVAVGEGGVFEQGLGGRRVDGGGAGCVGGRWSSARGNGTQVDRADRVLVRVVVRTEHERLDQPPWPARGPAVKLVPRGSSDR